MSASCHGYATSAGRGIDSYRSIRTGRGSTHAQNQRKRRAIPGGSRPDDSRAGGPGAGRRGGQPGGTGPALGADPLPGRGRHRQPRARRPRGLRRRRATSTATSTGATTGTAPASPVPRWPRTPTTRCWRPARTGSSPTSSSTRGTGRTTRSSRRSTRTTPRACCSRSSGTAPTYGVLRGAVTVAHSDFYSYTPAGSTWSSGRESVDGTLQTAGVAARRAPAPGDRAGGARATA